MSKELLLWQLELVEVLVNDLSHLIALLLRRKILQVWMQVEILVVGDRDVVVAFVGILLIKWLLLVLTVAVFVFSEADLLIRH